MMQQHLHCSTITLALQQSPQLVTPFLSFFKKNYLKTWSLYWGCGVSMDYLGFLYSLQAITGGGSAVARFTGEAPARPL